MQSAVRGARRSIRVGWRPSTPHSTTAVVVRGLASFALLWQFLWIASEPELWPSRQASDPTSLALYLSAVAWAAMLGAHLASASARTRSLTRAVNVGALGMATVAMLWAASAATPPWWGSASDLAALTAGIAGLLLETRVAMGLVGLLTAVWAVAVLGVWPHNAQAAHGFENLLYAAFVLCMGTVAIAARFVLTRDARRVDQTAASTARLERERRTEEDLAVAVRRQERVLHETVLNTLTAVVRGGLTSQVELRQRLAVRCREAAAVLRDLLRRSEFVLTASSDSRDLAGHLAGIIRDLRAAGMVVVVDCAPLDTVPAPVYSAVRTAAREALSNVLRHSGASTVWLVAQVRDTGDGLVIEVKDDGRGFDPGGKAARFGLTDAIGGPLAEVGGRSEVTSRPGAGTCARIEWRAGPEAVTVGTPAPLTADFVLPTLLAFGVYLLLAFALTWTDVQSPWLNAVALAIVLGAYALVARAARRGPFTWRIVAGVAIAGPVAYALQTVCLGDAAGQPWVAWASLGIAALFLVVIASGPAWAWPVLVIVWLLMQGDVVAEIVSPGTATLLAGALFGRSVRRNATAYERARAAEVAQSTALAVASEGVLRLHRRYGALRESYAVALLEGIAEGNLDPDDPLIREQAALEERFIRTVIRVDPAADPVHALASSLAVHARRGGVYLDVTLSDTELTAREDVLPSKPSLVRAVQCSIPGGVARLTARAEDEWLVIRLLAPIEWGRHGEMRREEVPGVVVEVDEPMMLWEIRLPAGGRS